MIRTLKHVTRATPPPGSGAAPALEAIPRFAPGTPEEISVDPDDVPVHAAGRWDVANLIHDLRHPVHNIAIEMSAMEQRLEATRANQDGIARVRESLAYMQRLIVELVDAAAAEDVELRLLPTELCSLLHRVMDRVVATADRERVCVEAPHSVVAHVDAPRMERVISKLLANALAHASAPGKIVMRLERRAGVVRLAVIDHGCGISPADASVVFDKYTGSASSSELDSSRIGLYLCRKIIEAHGGRIGLRSTLGSGSRFLIELPV